jgi:hypothetical protein
MNPVHRFSQLDENKNISSASVIQAVSLDYYSIWQVIYKPIKIPSAQNIKPPRF